MSDVRDEDFVTALGVLTFQLVNKDEGMTTTGLTFHRTQWFDEIPDDDEKIRPAADPLKATAGFDSDPSDGVVKLTVPTAQSSEWRTGGHYMAHFTAFDAPSE